MKTKSEIGLFRRSELDGHPLPTMVALDALYAHYHRLWWCYSQLYLHFKCRFGVYNALALLLAAIGLVTGELVQKTEVVVGLTALAMFVKGWHDVKKYNVKMDMCKFAYATYAKTLTELDHAAHSDDEFDKATF